MAIERTLSIVKPDAVAKNKVGEIVARFENKGLKVIAMKMMQLTREQAEGFYEVHKARPFFNSLVSFMTSGPVVLMAFEGENAVAKWRELMGATNSENAAPGTIRKLFADSIEANSVHGSADKASADREVPYFFRNEF